MLNQQRTDLENAGFKILAGDRVLYIPFCACGDVMHSEVEAGLVTRVKGDVAHVQFDHPRTRVDEGPEQLGRRLVERVGVERLRRAG